MSEPAASVSVERILVHAPRGRDAQVVCGLLGLQGLGTQICATLHHMAEAIQVGAGMAVVTEESLAVTDYEALADWAAAQPPWSDFPFLVLSSRRVGRRPSEAIEALRGLGNVVLLERPLNAETLVSAARSALRGRARQYETERHLAIEAASRRAEQAANAEALQARQALEVAVVAEREARLEAERAGRMKDEFLATLSHELRTPLSAILGWTHLLLHKTAKVDVNRAALTIERNARAQAALIEELLDVSRIASGTLRLDIAPVSLQAVFDAVLQSLQPTADAKHVAIERLPGEDIELEADANRLQQVVWNLVSNAIKFTPEGGHVRMRAERHGDQARLKVVDDGHGIPVDFLPHVFERFRQAESSSARSFGGLGLGLAIARQLVELHGGRIAVASEGPGHGAEFTVTLPLRQARAASVPVEPEPEPVVGMTAAADALQGLRILIVDDEDDGREMLGQLLEMHGAEIASAGSAEEALAMIDGAAPDVLISDIGMPRVDGYELIRRIRRLGNARSRNVPAIALTAFASANDSAKALEAGFAVHLAKPVEPDELFARIDDLVPRRRAA